MAKILHQPFGVVLLSTAAVAVPVAAQWRVLVSGRRIHGNGRYNVRYNGWEWELWPMGLPMRYQYTAWVSELGHSRDHETSTFDSSSNQLSDSIRN